MLALLGRGLAGPARAGAAVLGRAEPETRGRVTLGVAGRARAGGPGVPRNSGGAEPDTGEWPETGPDSSSRARKEQLEEFVLERSKNDEVAADDEDSPCSPVLQAARGYARPVAKKTKDIPSHLDDLPPTMLKKDYANLPVMSSVDDVVKRLLSLEMASQKEKMKVKKQQLVEKVRRSPSDNGSFEVQVAILTAKIRTLEEHLQKHPKDKKNRRFLLMGLDRRRKMLGYLRRVNYSTFEHTCKQLDIQYSPPQPYTRRVTKRWLVKKALCIKVFQEKRKLKAAERLKQRRAWQARARAAREQQEKQVQEKKVQEKVQEKQTQEGTPV